MQQTGQHGRCTALPRHRHQLIDNLRRCQEPYQQAQIAMASTRGASLHCHLKDTKCVARPTLRPIRGVVLLGNCQIDHFLECYDIYWFVFVLNCSLYCLHRIPKPNTYTHTHPFRIRYWDQGGNSRPLWWTTQWGGNSGHNWCTWLTYC